MFSWDLNLKYLFLNYNVTEIFIYDFVYENMNNNLLKLYLECVCVILFKAFTSVSV